MMDERASAWTGPHMEVAGVERVVVFQALHLGDLLCAVPAMRALKRRYPRAELTLIGLPWARSVVGRFGFLDRFLEFPGYRDLESVPWLPNATAQFLRDARAYCYDLAVQMHGDGRLSNSFVASLGARASIGYRPNDNDLTQQLTLELNDVDGVHEVARWIRLVEAVGASGSTEVEFPLGSGDWAEADELAADLGIDPELPVVTVHPGAKDPARRWPPERFAVVADALSAALGAQVLVTGTLGDLPAARRVVESMGCPAFFLAGRTSIGGLAALLARSTLVVTNDSGPSHLAAAVSAPSVVLFGPTNPARWAPLDDRAHISIWSGPGKPISTIPAETVIEGALGLVKRCAYLTF